MNIVCHLLCFSLIVLNDTYKLWSLTCTKSEYDQEIPQSHTADQPTAP